MKLVRNSKRPLEYNLQGEGVKRLFFILLLLLSASLYCEITVMSPKFKNGDYIDCRYTCDGEDVSPPISWTAGPKNTKSYVLILDDPDASRGTWVHWVLYNIPADTLELKYKFGRVGKVKLHREIKQGKNSFERFDYGGPCPPSGTHRYFFKVFAIDRMLRFPLKTMVDANTIMKAIEEHILAKGQIMFRYKRKPCPKKK